MKEKRESQANGVQLKAVQLKFLAVFLSMLIITLPFYTADVFAVSVSISNLKLTNSEGKENFRKPVDSTKIEVTVNSPDRPFSPVYLGWVQDVEEPDHYFNFLPNSCTYTNPYVCTFNVPEDDLNAEDAKNPDSFDVCVNIYGMPGINRGVAPTTCNEAREMVRSGNNLITLSKGISVDREGPIVSNIDPKTIATKGESETAISYTVKDTTGSAKPGCVGTAKVVFYKSTGELITEEELNKEASVTNDACGETKTYQLDTAAFDDGSLSTICLVPKDNFENVYSSYLNEDGTLVEGDNCFEVTKDSRTPTFDNIVYLFDSTGQNEIKYVSDQIIDVMLVANVTTFTHEKEEITADITSLGASQTTVTFEETDCKTYLTDEEKEAEANPTAEPAEETSVVYHYQCTKKVKLDPAGEASRTITLKAKDAAENEAESSATLAFEVDITAPSVRGITSERIAFGGIPIFGAKNNTIIAVIEETQSGISPETIIINGNENGKKPLCEKTEEGVFHCKLTNYDIQSDKLTVRVKGSDIAGKTFEYISPQFNVDRKSPQFVEAQILSQSPTQILTPLEPVVLRLFLKEESAMSSETETRAVALIRFSAENPEQWKPADQCALLSALQAQPEQGAGAETSGGATSESEETSETVNLGLGPKTVDEYAGIWRCDWTIPELEPNANVEVSFANTKDLAGNQIKLPDDHPEKSQIGSIDKVDYIYLVNADASGNEIRVHPSRWNRIVAGGVHEGEQLWNVVATKFSPTTAIDAKGVKVAQLGAWFKLAITAKPSATSGTLPVPVSINLADCTGEDYTNYMLAEKTQLISFANLQQKKPIIKFVLRQGPLPEDKASLVFECEAAIKGGIKSGTGYSQVTTPTNAKFEVIIPLANLKDLDDNVWEEIVDQLDDWYIFGGWLDTLYKWLGYSEALCKVYYSISNIVGALYILNGILFGVAKAVPAVEPAHAAADAANRGTGSMLQTLEEILTTVCDFVTCRQTPTMLWDTEFWKEKADISGWLEDMSRNNLNNKQLEQVSYSKWANPESSLIMSAATLCIPGIIKNLHKIRVMKCKYVQCLYTKVAAGYPKYDICDKPYRYEQCMIVVGEIFLVFPYLHIAKTLLGKIKKLVTEPVSLAVATGNVLCHLSETAEKHLLCQGMFVIQRIIQVGAEINSIYSTITGLFEEKDDETNASFCADIISEIEKDPRYDIAKEAEEAEEEGRTSAAERTRVPDLPGSATGYQP